MPYYNAICKGCGRPFRSFRHRNQNPPSYCSHECRRNRTTITCPICGKSRVIKKGHLDSHATCGAKACTAEYKWRQYAGTISDRIGEPLESAVQRLYILERKTYRQICEALHINTRTLMKALRRAGIEPRKSSEAIAVQWENNDGRKAAQGVRMAQVGRDHGGERHPFWRGGISFKHGRNWTAELRATIRNRDGRRCTHCGRYRPLDVHHIIPYWYSHDNSPSNLRSVCRSCHGVLERQFRWLL